MNTSYHPRHPYQNDIRALGENFLVLIGEKDEANDPAKFPEVMQTSSESLQVIGNVRHLNIVRDPMTMQAALNWIKLKTTQDIDD